MLNQQLQKNNLKVWNIEFNFISETVNKSYGDDNTVSDITLEKLQAINKQIEELGWNNVSITN